MRRSQLAFLLAVLVSLAGCSYFPPIIGSGKPVTLSYTFVDFSGIEASHNFTVSVVPDTVYSVEVSFDDNLAPYLVVANQGGTTLALGLQEGYSYTNVTLSAVVHMPSLTAIDASGASAFLVRTGFADMRSLSVVLSGASSCQAAGVTCSTLSVDLSGASSITLNGSADSISSEVSEASTAHLLDCPTAFAEVDISGASKCYVNVPTGSIAAELSGASTLYYSGSPSFSSLDLSGASQLVKVD